MNWSASRLALVLALLIATPGLGCNKLERWGRQSDELLDDINGSPRSDSSGSSSHRSSGLSVVKRKAMPERTFKDARGNPATLRGRSDSTSKTPGHDSTIAAEALEMVQSGKYEYVTMQRSWRTATGRVSDSGLIPDIMGVRRDGRVDALEVKSNSDKTDALRRRLRQGMNTSPPERRGRYDVLQPNR
jgi:hypothetical protein